MPIVFQGTTFGNVVANTTYFVKSSPFSANIPIATVSRSGTAATIVTSVNHGLASGQIVNINLTGTALDTDNAVTIIVVDATTFTYTSGGTGTIGPDLPAVSGRIIPDSKITISATPDGAALALSTASGTMTASAGGNRTATISIATPAEVTATAHGFEPGDVVRFDTQTGGALPSGVDINSNYHVISAGLTANTFRFAVTPGGTAVDTSGSQSGTHSVTRVSGREGDTTWAVVAVAEQVQSRVVGSKFIWQGEEYIVTQYDSEAITNEPFARIYVNRPLKNSLVAYSSSYTIKGAVPIRSNGSLGNLTIRISLTRVTSHDLLEIGTGSYADTNYPKELYGSSVNPLNEKTEVEERDVGRVFYVTTDQFGNFRVGPFFKVDQGTGTVTFAASIALSNLDGIGFKRGVPVSEFSTDSAMSDNFTDTVPTENAVRIFMERKLGITYSGLNAVRDEELLPPVIGGFMPLFPPVGVAMKAAMNLGNNLINDLADPIDLQDAVNLRSLTWNNFQDATITSPVTGQLVSFTGTGDAVINVGITGDVTATRNSSDLNIQLNAGVVNNAEVNDAAGIAQSKLAMTTASTRVNATGITQADRGLASFDDSVFAVTDGWVTVKDNGLVLADLPQIATRTVLANATGGTANVSAIAFTTVINDGGAVKKLNFGQNGAATGFLRRITSGDDDSSFTTVEAATGTAANPEASKLVLRSAAGNFGANIVDLNQLNIDTKLAIDTGTTATGGFIRYYGWDSAGGIVVFNGSVNTDKRTAYWNNSHEFRTQDGQSLAPISSSSVTTTSIQATTLTTGGNTIDGTITGRWTLSGTFPDESRLQSTYSADLAEYYEGDQEYEVGTVLVFGGDREVTTTNTQGDNRVAGVVSNTAAFAMYEGCPGLKNLVALQGRVPCRVVGKIRKGEMLVTSKIPGVAVAGGNDIKVGTVVGKALVDYDSDHIGKIEIAVGRT
jgi:hypothetical protein